MLLPTLPSRSPSGQENTDNLNVVVLPDLGERYLSTNLYPETKVIAQKEKTMSSQRAITAGLLGLLCTLGGGCSPNGPCCSPGSNPARSSPHVAAVSTNQQVMQGAHCCSPATDPANQKASQGADCCSSSSANRTAPIESSAAVDPARQAIFKVEGLTCPAVKGLGCGHRIAPVLARLNKIEGVEKSFANRTGTMLRICVAPSAERDKVVTEVREDLTEDNRKPVSLMGDEFKEALVKEKWSSPGDLSAIEFRTLALHRVKNFTESEKLDKETADKLMNLAEQQWDCIAKGADCCEKVQQPSDWLTQFNRFATAMPDQAKELLTAGQVERLREVLTKRFSKEKDLPVPADAKHKTLSE